MSQVELGKASKNVTSLSPPPPALIKDDHKVPLNKDRAPSSNIVVNLAAQKTNKGVQSKNTRSTPSRGIRPAKTQSEIIAERMRRKEKGAQSDNSETSSESSTSFSRAYNVSTLQRFATYSLYCVYLHLLPSSCCLTPPLNAPIMTGTSDTGLVLI